MFKVDKEMVKKVAGWVVTGIDEKEVKKDRESFKPKLARKSELLINPELDESFYYRLKTLKNSKATKSNIDPIEKIYRSQTFKILDLAKPLLFLHSRGKLRKKTKSDSRAIKIALRLWATLLNDITKARRRNILSQIYPGFTSLLDNKKILPADGGEHLFGPKFIGELVDQMKTMNTMRDNEKSSEKSAPHQKPAATSTPSASTSSAAQRSNSNSNSRYVSFLAFSGAFGGRVSLFVPAWKNISKDPWVLEAVTLGLKLEFHSVPTQLNMPPCPALSDSQISLCNKEVSSLIEKGAVIEVDSVEGEFVSNLFVIPKKTPGKFRPIINLKALNRHIVLNHFKMEGISTVKETIREGDWLAKLDLKDAYFTIPVFHEHRKFLRFRWGRAIYEYVSLPFGLSSAPWAFTKLLRVVVAFLRRKGIHLVIYLDDILLIGSSRLAAIEAVRISKSLLESLGFVICSEKSIEDPSQSIEYLGLVINTVLMTVQLTEKKIVDIK